MGDKQRSNFRLATISFVISLAAQRGLPFLALPIVARATSQSEYGGATLAVAFASVLSVVMTLGINAAMPRLYTQPRRDAVPSPWVALTLVQVAFAGVLVIALWFAALSFGPTVVDDEYQSLIVPGLLLALVSSLQMTYQGIAIARGASTRLLVATLIQLTAGLILAQTLSTTFGGRGYIYALLIASTLATAVLVAFRHPKPDWKYIGIRSGLRLSAPFIGQGLSTWLLALFDRIVIGMLLGVSQVGGYQVAYMAGSMLGMILEGLQAAWAPKYHKSRNERKRELLSRLLVPSAAIAGGMTALLVGATPLVLPLVAPNYELNYALVWLVALSSVPRSIYFVCVVALLDEGRSATVMTSTLVSAIFTVPAAIILISLFGLIGGGIVTLAAFTVQSLFVCHRTFGLRFGRTARLVVGPLLLLAPPTGAILLLAQVAPVAMILVPGLLIPPALVLAWKSLKVFGYVLSGWQKQTDEIRPGLVES